MMPISDSIAWSMDNVKKSKDVQLNLDKACLVKIALLALIKNDNEI